MKTRFLTLHGPLAFLTSLALFCGPKAMGQGFTNLHNFVFTNGTYPRASLILSSNTLYGTTQNYGGGTGGGYGSVFSLLVPPVLNIQLSETNVILTWPTSFTGFSLQTTTNLAPPVNWSALSGQYSVTNPTTNKQKFFRLIHP